MGFKILSNNREVKSPQAENFYDEYNRHPSIVVAPQGGNHYTVNISQNFGEAYTFDSVIALLSNATEYDDITFNINSRGGNLFSLIALQNAISVTQARYHMVLLGEACSAGGALFLTEGASTYSVGHNSMLMIHPVQCGGGYGAAGEQFIRADVNAVLNERFVRTIYKDFLTEDEINDVIINNREIYLFDEEINERLANRIEIRKAELEDKMKELSDVINTNNYDDVPDEVLKQERSDITAELKKRAKVATKVAVSQ